MEAVTRMRETKIGKTMREIPVALESSSKETKVHNIPHGAVRSRILPNGHDVFIPKRSSTKEHLLQTWETQSLRQRLQREKSSKCRQHLRN